MRHDVLYTAAQIASQVEILAEELDAADVDSYLVLTVLKGAAIFSSDLVRAMNTETELEYVTARSYMHDFTPGESVTIRQTTRPDVRGRDVLIVEDIIDTGRTLQKLHQNVTNRDPRSVTTVTLVNKTSRRETDFEPDHTGFDITQEFVYGYGLDWNQKYRDLPFLAVSRTTSSG